MSTFDWIALIGAAAWLPQIAAAIYRWLIKPEVILIPVPEIEVGYNFLGPILNLKAALFAQRKDATILDMNLKLTHAKGRSIALTWHSFVEKFSEVRSKGEKSEIARDQEATALKLTTLFPTEKFIRFQDPAWQEQNRQLTLSADAEFNRLKLTASDPASAFLASQTHADLLNFYKHNFPWEDGKYELELSIQVLERRAPAIARTHLHLSERDVDELRENLAFIEKNVEQIAEGVEEGERVFPSKWATPRLPTKRVMAKT